MDNMELELESMFEDMSDYDDPTYNPPNEYPKKQIGSPDSLITLEDLLDNNPEEHSFDHQGKKTIFIITSFCPCTISSFIIIA